MKIRYTLWAAVFLKFPNLHASAETLHVSLTSTNPVPPYAGWSTAATNIQDAIDASSDGDLILVTNGVYKTGGRVIYGSLMNRVAIDKPVTVESANGPSVTFIEGSISSLPVRCVYTTNGATLIGFTLKDGMANDPSGGNQLNGGGIWSESTNVIVTNCVIADCLAEHGAGVCSATLYNCKIITNPPPTYSCHNGGGAYLSVLNNCTLVGNRADTGGAAANSSFFNCTIVSNSAHIGGGAAYSTLFSCTIVSNSAPSGSGGGTAGCVVSNCTVIGNSAPGTIPKGVGGGAFGGTLDYCTLIENSATAGGGAAGGIISGIGTVPIVLNNCIISSNVALEGGGVFVQSSGSLSYTNCILNNCLLSSNSGNAGGGAFLAELNNCTISNNVANNTFGEGGGVEGGLLNNCILTENSAYEGGGAYMSTLYNCTVIGNTAGSGGGTWYSTVFNSIVYYNSAHNGADTIYSGLYFCCTPDNGFECVTNEPLFVNLANDDFYLQSNSPCINSGNNAYVTSATDLDGNPRIQGGTVDIGAYEYQVPTSVISYAWLQQYGLPTDGSVDYADLDGTPFNVYQDWIAGLNPTNALSVLAMLPPVPTNNPAGLIVSWQSVSNRTYFLQSSTNLAAQPAFSTLQSNIVGQPDMTSFMDTNAVGNGPFFYRVGVQ